MDNRIYGKMLSFEEKTEILKDDIRHIGMASKTRLSFCEIGHRVVMQNLVHPTWCCDDCGTETRRIEIVCQDPTFNHNADAKAAHTHIAFVFPDGAGQRLESSSTFR